MCIRDRIPDGQLHYIWRPGEVVPIVCFHQTASSSESYRKIMQQSVIRNPMYAFDTPGFGGSFDPIGIKLKVLKTDLLQQDNLQIRLKIPVVKTHLCGDEYLKS